MYQSLFIKMRFIHTFVPIYFARINTLKNIQTISVENYNKITMAAIIPDDDKEYKECPVFIKPDDDKEYKECPVFIKPEPDIDELCSVLDQTTISNDVETPESLFDRIKTKLNTGGINNEFIQSIKTQHGNTQVSERIVIAMFKEILTSMNLSFVEASSQQSKDFRNVGGINLNIEVKKTDSPSVIFNDTCPTIDIYYVILFTGTEYKSPKRKNIPPKLLYLNGEEFTKDSPWLSEYIAEITALKDKYARGENKKKLKGIMAVYPRPTFRADISGFLKNNETDLQEDNSKHINELIQNCEDNGITGISNIIKEQL